MFPLRALRGGAALLLLTGTAACQASGSGASDGASVDEFCEAYFGLFSGEMSEIDPGASEREQGKAMTDALRAWAAELEEVGTPDDMPDLARAGFEVIVSAAAELAPGDAHNLADLDDDFTEDDLDATQAFEEYATQNCESPFDNPTQ